MCPDTISRRGGVVDVVEEVVVAHPVVATAVGTEDAVADGDEAGTAAEGGADIIHTIEMGRLVYVGSKLLHHNLSGTSPTVCFLFLGMTRGLVMTVCVTFSML
jgi:hypothetical protein